MLSLPELVQIHFCMQPTDMRKGFDSLAALVRDHLGYDPLSGHLFVFRSRRGDRVKMLCWEHDGFTLYYCKRPAEHVLLAVVPWVRPTREPKEVRHGRVEQVETGRDTRVLGSGHPAVGRERPLGSGVLQS